MLTYQSDLQILDIFTLMQNRQFQLQEMAGNPEQLFLLLGMGIIMSEVQTLSLQS